MQILFVIRLTKPGLYKFQVFARPASDSSEDLPNVVNYIIEVLLYCKCYSLQYHW